MISQREQAFFGGWSRRVLGSGTHKWGDPIRRVQEVTPATACVLLMPPSAHIAASGQPGVSYYVFNTGSAACTIRDPDSGADVVAVPAGDGARMVFGSKWRGWVVGPHQFGQSYPSLRFDLAVTVNTANVNVLQRIIAAGYDGSAPAVAILTISPGVAVGSIAEMARSIDSGGTIGSVSWAAGSRWMLVVPAGAVVGGWGGIGGGSGIPGTGQSAGLPGGNGGQAVRTEIPMTITCDGDIFGGGGGGGGGGSILSIPAPPTPTPKGGGGGGGAGINMISGGVIVGSSGGVGASNDGERGGTLGPGIGAGGTGGGGFGGWGGARSTDGDPGGASTSGAAGGAGGDRGEAISYLPAAGAPSIIASFGSIVGGSVAEAS